ncbi:TIGR03749 family integrating conjugative element protein [Chitinimonas lacunae]|uniref:TIGR03749 family integrating conjugative element protein n=1 Tax=Chitinimonas lacunae TaxID=1963018 RepID=A0ABV8MTN3_9NEIS
MKPATLSALLNLVLVLAALPAHAIELRRWERLPVAVSLHVGQERVVFVDSNVRVGVPAALGNRLRVQSAAGAIYLLASGPIASSRLQVQDVETGALILLDITAMPAKDGQAALEPVRIVQGDAAPTAEEDPVQSVDGERSQPMRRAETPVAVVLTRYAAQSLYAPLRTVEPVAGIQRVNLRRDLALDRLLPTLSIRAHTLAAWQLDDHWVTAIQLTNTSTRWLVLDPRVLQGHFIAATFQHPDLGPVGQSTDTTVLYLITRGHGLAESMLPNLRPFDAGTTLPSSTVAGHAEGAPDEK